jgi:TetR/AcrR family transcriptional regulator
MDPRKQRTVNSLLRAAEELFRAHTVDEVTVDDIAARAGVAVGSLYNHFGSKAGLHAAVVENALQADRHYMDRAYLSDGTPLEQLYAAADAYLDFYLAHPDYFRMLAFPGAPGQYQAGHELTGRLAHSVDEQNKRLASALRRAIDAAQLSPVDPEDVATVLWASWNGIISLHWRPDALRRDEAQLRALLNTATRVIATGLLPRSRADTAD